ncbi:hypothetical protein KJ765_01700 [Candidatus Micrarchaeota archaeon]|nr:hypothetical protein [Candidatus Micrarchaeota archaeon]
MRVKTYLRKGAGNKKFVTIVKTITDALGNIDGSTRIKEALLEELTKNRSNLGAAWQDGDQLLNILGKNSDHRFDIYNWETKTAIEVEESEVKYVCKDFVKLAIGARRGRVANAMLVCPIAYGGKTLKRPVAIYTNAVSISHFMSDFLWMKNLAIIGYEK